MVLQATYFKICENTLWIGNFCLFDQPCGEALQIVSWTFDRLVRIVTDVSDNFYVVGVPKLAAEQDYCRLLAVCGKLFPLRIQGQHRLQEWRGKSQVAQETERQC